MREEFILVGVIAIAVLIAGTYFVLWTGGSDKNPITENESREIAREFVESSATYRFDGFDLVYVETLYPDISNHSNLYTFVFEFKSKHGGYGDRTGQQLTEVITPHEAHVTVENGKVIRAVLDSRWDMIKQKFIENDETIQFENYVFDHLGYDMPIIEGGITYQDENMDMRNFIALISSREDTDRFNYSLLDESANRFIENTNFKNSVLVVFQESPASSYPNYRVEKVSLEGNGGYMFMNNYSEMGTDDITIETVLVRVHLEESPCRVVTITEEGRTFETPPLTQDVDEVEAAKIGRIYLEGVLSKEGYGPWVGDLLEAKLSEKVPNDYWYQIIVGDSGESISQKEELDCWVLRFEQAKRPGHWFEVWVDSETGDILGGTQCRYAR
ncbi:hypothetical protein AKJ39_03595 [candidate division MSBL1 archaeon SCGC-AAA259J03]|uniref:Uncharacterized protein n=1 Tax=candidate division MSBL1 archaeon SCGC-AAA259J03 TaxID=1698269 RepID=A0A656YW89_9EURY|nr:hypothetical protein AKJ39_03595 [candidate division MSBL1 archaeon SCGC-AAA259J03]